ncbi:MAG: UDP-N-acetylglucosamine diphosphorylase/glucosamine-1-phosphate N-acetyltransferase [Chloroflexi bacterium]|nr:UDP-N-acetylglucosamine diphosphorylase/glucosamine-1-phosphate N-acetyltransferase [Chloroflexota bacterium]
MARQERDEPPDSASGAIVLAAGRGERMRSEIPKVLHTVGGVPLIRRVLTAVRAAGFKDVIVVVGAESDAVRAALPPDVRAVVQPQPRGTGDAVRVGLEQLDTRVRNLVVVGGDTPLVTSQTLREVAGHVPPATVAMATAMLERPTGYGRVILDERGNVARVVEEVYATGDERDTQLVNGMIFAFDVPWLASALPRIGPAPNGELYLTALVAEARQGGCTVRAVKVQDPREVLGVNTRAELAVAEAVVRERVTSRLMEAGVSLVDPASTFVDESVVIGQDVVIHPQCYLRGETVVGDGCVLGPGTEVIDSRIGRNVRIWWSVVEGADVGPRVQIGPYSRIRPSTTIEADVTVGSFAEIKNSLVGAGTQMHHFGYLGDAEVGPGVNIGAGAITVNYDGVVKHRTVIGARAFVGSDTMLVAPVTIGEEAMTGAGSVVTRNVPAGGRVVGVPARPIPSRRNQKPALPTEG